MFVLYFCIGLFLFILNCELNDNKSTFTEYLLFMFGWPISAPKILVKSWKEFNK